MKTLLVVALVALSFGAFAQQLTIDPATSNETLGIEALELLPSGEMITVGFVGDYAHISCENTSGVLDWSFTCTIPSVLYEIASTSDGNFVAVGLQGNNGFAVKFSASGNIAWSKTFASNLDTNVVFRDVFCDAGGIIRITGDKYVTGNRREILIRLDSSGNILCGTQLATTSTTFSGKRVFVSGGYTFVFGDGRRFGRGIGVAKYTASEVLVSYKVFGGFGPNDNFLDAVLVGNEFVFSYWNNNAPGIVTLARMDQNLNLLGSPVQVVSSLADYWTLDVLGRLTASNTPGEFYLSGGMYGNGFNASYILKTDIYWSPSFGRNILFGSLPTETVVAEDNVSGEIFFAKTRNMTPLANTGVTVTKLSPLGNAITFGYCDPPDPFGFELWQTSLPIEVQVRTQSALTLSVGTTSFAVYNPRLNPCGMSMLPVELLSFDGQQNGESVKLRWTTASEHNSSHFEVLRLSDKGSFDPIGSVASFGQSVSSVSYEFTDDAPAVSGNYYQLAQVDANGTRTLSEVVFVSFVENAKVYPNPVSSGQSLHVFGGQGFRIFGLHGELVLESASSEAIMSLSSGIYTVQILPSMNTTKLFVE